MRQTLQDRTKTFSAFLSLRTCPMLLLCLMLCGIIGTANAQKKAKGVIRKSVSTSISSDYKQVGNTLLYCYQSSSSIDFMGLFDSQYYGSTFSNNGYNVAMQVGDNDAEQVNCLDSTLLNGVKFTASVEQQGELARICYNVTNTNESDTTISLGIHADIMIGSNDAAPISKRTDTNGNTYGLTLMDGNGAQLCALFGSNLKGVTGVDDYWFGDYSQNNDADAMVGNYTQGSYWMEENGSYDSGMGFCWKNRTIPAGATVTFSWLIGVGDVNLEPSSSFEVTPDDPEGWNDLSRPHRLTLEGEYESPAGLDGMIEYTVENSEEWLQLTDTLASGDTFTASLVANFDATLSTHTIHFRTVDNVGNTTLLPSIEYEDVSFISLSGIEYKTYTGDSLYQTTLVCDLADTCYVATNYQNNVNAGTASFSMEGVFPYTIGRKQYTFTINPAPLQGEIQLSSTTYIYNGESFQPEWDFSDSQYAALAKDTDYVVTYENNLLPGTAVVKVKGIGNYTDSLTAEFVIDKAQLTDSLYVLTLPNEDISYDGLSHGATINTMNGIGTATITYTNYGETTALAAAPMEEGSYDIYLEIAEGTLYYGKEKTLVGTFAIYNLDETEWTALSSLYAELSQNLGYTPAWDFSQGAKAVSSFDGLQIEKGHIVGIDLSSKGLTGLFPTSVLAFTKLSSINLSSNNLTGDLPTALMAVVSQDTTLTANVTTLDISGNNYSGNVGILAQCFPALTTLNASANAFEDVYPVISATVTNLNLSNQTMTRTIDVDMSTLSEEDIANFPTLPFYDHANQTYTTNIDLLCSAVNEDWIMQVSLIDGQISLSYLSEQNAYYGNSGDTLNVSVQNTDSTVDGCSFRFTMTFAMGDANFINGVDASDLQATILYAFGAYNTYPFNFTAADTYTDNNINVQDVVRTANILLADTVSTNNAAMRARASYSENVDTDADAYIYIKGGKIILNANSPVAAISVKMSANAEWNLDQYGLDQVSSKTGAVGYSLNGATLPIGETKIGTCQSNATILKVSVADAEAKALKVAIGESSTTSINTFKGSEDDSMQIYDLSGRKTDNLQKGVNIVTKDGRSYKIVNNK